MELKQLRIFRELAQERHFARTASILGVSPATISQSLSRLEAEIGQTLINRDSRNVALTPQGSFFLTEISAALERIDGATEILRMQQRDIDAHLRIGTSFPGSKLLLPAALDFARDTHPELVVIVKNLGSALQEEALANDEIDIGFLTGEAFHPGIESAITLSTDIVCLTRPGHPVARTGELDLRLAHHFPYVGSMPGARTGIEKRVLAAAATVGATLGPAVTVSDDLYLDAASSDMIIFCTRPRAEQGAASGLRLVNISPAPDPLPLHVAWRRSEGNHYVNSIRTFLASLCPQD